MVPAVAVTPSQMNGGSAGTGLARTSIAEQEPRRASFFVVPGGSSLAAVVEERLTASGLDVSETVSAADIVIFLLPEQGGSEAAMSYSKYLRGGGECGDVMAVCMSPISSFPA